MHWCHRQGCDGRVGFQRFCMPAEHPAGKMAELKARNQSGVRPVATGAAARGQEELVEEEQAAGEVPAEAVAAGAAAGGQEELVEEEQAAGEDPADAGGQDGNEVAEEQQGAGAAQGAPAEATLDELLLEGLSDFSEEEKEEAEAELGEKETVAELSAAAAETAHAGAEIEGSVSAPCPSEDLQGEDTFDHAHVPSLLTLLGSKSLKLLKILKNINCLGCRSSCSYC